MFSIQSMKDHPTYTRLMEVASDLGHVLKPAELAKLLNVLDQHVNNWRARGIPKDIIIDLADEWGFRAKYVRDGEGNKFIDPYQYLKNQEKLLLEIHQKLPDFGRKELLSDAIRKAELIAKARSEKN